MPPKKAEPTESSAEPVEVSVDPEPNNLPMVLAPAGKAIEPYHGIGMVPITTEQAALLEAPIDPEQLDILPTGEVYMSQVWYRRKLNHVFGAGHWGLLPRGPFTQQDATLMREYALIVNGCFVADSIGEADYHPNNDRMSYATAAEALKSNALSRLCKDLGIASECWDKRFAEGWIDKYAVAVWRRDAKKRAPQWRRRDAKPFYDETGTVEPHREPAPAPQKPATPSAAPKAPNPPASAPNPAQRPAARPTGQPAGARLRDDGYIEDTGVVDFHKDGQYGWSMRLNGVYIDIASKDGDCSDMALASKATGQPVQVIYKPKKNPKFFELVKMRWTPQAEPVAPEDDPRNYPRADMADASRQDYGADHPEAEVQVYGAGGGWGGLPVNQGDSLPF